MAVENEIPYAKGLVVPLLRHPGVYTRKLRGLPPAIRSAETSIAAFVGFFRRGPLDRARTVTSYSQFERIFGRGVEGTEGSAAVEQFFANGGKKAVVVRAAGKRVSATALRGPVRDSTGMRLLSKVDLFNILCVPDTVHLTDLQARSIARSAITLCRRKRAIYLLDIPQKDTPRNSVESVKEWLHHNAVLADPNVATYFPRLLIPNPSCSSSMKTVASSGTIAGLYARVDASRGVWKAPAGVDATLRGVRQLEKSVTAAEIGELNLLGVNCLRRLPGRGLVCWGSRTLAAGTESDWRYVPVRRLALHLEESLYRGLHWVVFEPNDEPLWASVRSAVGRFMNGLFRKGAFQGAKAQDAYFVKCDRSTMTQNDLNRGTINVLVGFAPLKPAEFVVLRLSLRSG